jgi:hypothetical protein
VEAKDTVSRLTRSLRAVLRCGILNTPYRINRFRARDIWPNEAGINVHSSVKVRMDDPEEKYEPRAKLPGVVNWVD